MRLIAAGGFGAVWRAQQKALDRPVAVKMLHADLAGTPEAVQRFESEARLTAQIRHEGVVTLLDHGVTENVPWMAFEFIEGPSLRSWVERGPQPWRRVAEMARQVALALYAARSYGVVHRDVKPDNILQAGEGRFKLADFGVAKRTDVSGTTQEGVILGTPAYISPVQVKGLAPEHQSDLYALGVTMYELLSGSLPFQDENPLLLLERHLHQTPPPLGPRVPDLPPALERIVMRLLAKERAERFDTAQELADALADLLKPPAPNVTRVASADRSDGRPFREWAMPLAALAVVAAIVGGRLSRHEPVAPQPTASPAVSALASSSLPVTPVDPALVGDLRHEALRLLSEADWLLAAMPRNEDTFLGGPVTSVDMPRLRRAVESYRQLVVAATPLWGPGTEPLMHVERTGWMVVAIADLSMDRVRLGPLNAPQRAELPHVAAALKRLGEAVHESRGTPLGDILDVTLGPQIEPVVAGKSRSMDLVAPTAARAARLTAAAFPGSTSAELTMQRIELLDRAAHTWLQRRRRNEDALTKHGLAPSLPEERDVRETIVSIAPAALALQVSDPLLEGHVLKMHEQLTAGAAFLAIDELASLDVRKKAARALADALLGLRAIGKPYDALPGQIKQLDVLESCAPALGLPLNAGKLQEAREYFRNAGAVKRPWPLHIEPRRPRDPR